MTGSPTLTSTGRQVSDVDLVVAAASLLLGLLLLTLPQRTLLLVAVLLGVQLVVLGVVRTTLVVRSDVPPVPTAVGLGISLLVVIAGIVVLVRPGASLVVVASAVGIGWILDGLATLVSIRSRATTDRWAVVPDGALSIAGGLGVLIFPGESLRLVAQVAGVVLLVLAASRVVTVIGAWRRAR